MSEYRILHTTANIIVASSHPNCAMIYVRVQILSERKSHVRTRKVIAMRRCCSPRERVSVSEAIGYCDEEALNRTGNRM